MNDMNKNPIFTLKNFRSFGEDGADFELAPITVLTGCNSAGKSSLVKALMLLSKQRVYKTNSLSGDRVLPDDILHISSSGLELGEFKSVIHQQDTKKELVFSYSMWSNYLNEEVICKRVYCCKKGGRNEAELKLITIEKEDGTEIYRAFLDNTILWNNDGTEDVVYFLNESDDIECLRANIISEYQKFLSVYKYLFYGIRAKKLNNSHPNSDPCKELFRLQNEAREQLASERISVEEAEKYDEKVIFEWHEINDPFNKNVLDKEYEDRLTEEEKEARRLKRFYNCVINEVITPWFIKDSSFIDSSSNKISRAYNIKDTDKFSVLLCKLVEDRDEYTTSQFVNDWLKEFKIGEKITVVRVGAGLGAEIYIHNNGMKRLLADEGYGITQIASLLLQIDLIKHSNNSNDDDEIVNKPTFICVEEPEIHLHPNYQAKLAELFVDAYQKYNIHFIIETHSEYLIRKLQVMVADKENTLTSNDVSLNYVEKDENGISTNRKIEIQEDGGLSDSFGSGFYDAADSLALDLFRKKPILS